MCFVDEELAYAEVLDSLFRNKPLRDAINDPAMWTKDTAGRDVVKSGIQLGVASGGLLNIEGWWYLVFRTCSGDGARVIVEWCASLDTDAKFMTPYKFATPEEEKESKEKFRRDFQIFLRGKAKWWESSYAGIAANGVGPWPKPGGEGW